MSSISSTAFHRAFVTLLLCTMCLTSDVLAQLKDAAGSKDHALIKRFEGSTILGYEFLKFDSLVILLGPLGSGDKPTKSQQVEGELTRILYVAPKQRSPLEVLRNYEQELQRTGFQTLFKCARKECGGLRDGHLGFLYLYRNRPLKNTPQSRHVFYDATNQQFMTAKRTSQGADAYVSVYAAQVDSSASELKEIFGQTAILLEVVETVSMENKMVTVDAGVMAKEVAATGRVALYGINFDTDKADIKPESATAIGEIAKFLKADPRIVVYIVGHTDNVGEYEHNIGLSLRRAEAVVKELTTKHGIPAARLKAAGTGSLAPMAPNDTEDGRAKNRRVEVVKQ